MFSRDVLLSLAEKYKPKPFGEEAIKKKLQERQIRLAAAEVERKNTDSDFKGLKIDQLSGESQEPDRKVSSKTGDPIGYDEKEYLDKVEKIYKEYVKIGRQKSLNNAAENLEYFLEGSGKQKKLSREEARSRVFVINGEEANRKRFTESLVSKTKAGSKLLKLKNGEAIKIKDNWDYEAGYLPEKSVIDPSKSHLLRGDLDEVLSTGTSFVKSGGSFNVKRKGDTIHIDGIVIHRWEDKYDFDPMQSGGAGAVALEEAGRAKSYDIKSNWKQRVTGTLQIKNGELVNPRLTWQDINFQKEE
ncbi:MAG: hypothetical protein OEY94_06570 [Alphaproteobacteria bacterium]|nr:hypothetical protein [Alphaproteobacteria bacterium]